MSLTNLIAEHILQVYAGNNWTDVSIAETIAGISFQQAQQHTAGSPNTIASLLHHLCYWNGIMLQRMQGETPVIPEENGYNVPFLNNEAEWNALKNKVHQSFITLAEATKKFPEEMLAGNYAPSIPSTYYRNFHGIIEHAHYHLGQIVILKNLLKA